MFLTKMSQLFHLLYINILVVASTYSHTTTQRPKMSTGSLIKALHDLY